MLDVAGVSHDRPATPEAIAALFDRAVAVSPEASVAIYSLGDRARLEAATSEIVDWLRRTGCLGLHHDVLDLGCGIGRVTMAVAPYVRSVLGTEISAGMLREASRRQACSGNAWFLRGSGQDLAALADASFDLVLAVDSFPYLVQACVAARHMAEIRRVLRRPGRLVIFNLSYREDPADDRRDAEDWARRFGFALSISDSIPFRTWDARVYIFNC